MPSPRPPYRKRIRLPENPVIKDAEKPVFVRSQKASKTFASLKAVVWLRIGDQAPARTINLRSVSLTARQARTLAKHLLMAADEIEQGA